MKYLLIGIILLILVIVIVSVKNDFKDSVDGQSSEHSAEFYKYYNSVNSMSIKQLNKVHDDLFPLVTKTLVAGMVWYDDDIPYSEKKAAEEKIAANYVIIPENERIYGCVRYDEAVMLDEAVRKRLP